MGGGEKSEDAEGDGGELGSEAGESDGEVRDFGGGTPAEGVGAESAERGESGGG